MKKFVLMMLRALILVALTSTCWSLPDLEPTYCFSTTQGYHCAHCLLPVYCDSDGALTAYNECTLGTVCEMVDGVAMCVPKAEAERCECSSAFCDPYNAAYTDMCNTNGIFDVIDCTDVNPEYSCHSGTCGYDGSSTTSSPMFSCHDPGAVVPGWNLEYPNCDKAYYCAADYTNEVITICTPGLYVDQNGVCRETPPVPCAYSCSGYCPDETDCTRFYTCNDGVVETGPYTCDPGFYFDPNASPPYCSGTDESVCAPVTKCDLSGRNA